MAAGCRIPGAANFNGTAAPDDYSCIFLLKNQDNCHWFEDVPPEELLDHSFTMSFSVKGDGWVFFHDYLPDMYFHTRSRLYNTKDSAIYTYHELGNYGIFHDQAGSPKSFFIDVVFQSDKDLILETVNWVTEMLLGSTDQPFQTLTHITIWNSHQHTGRIPVDKIQAFTELTARRTKGEWILNDFRNILVSKGTEFLQDLFHDYLVVTAQADANQAWYNKELLIDKWFCVRFELDNTAANSLVLHDTTIQAIKSDR
jgi:hypothetical protein